MTRSASATRSPSGALGMSVTSSLVAHVAMTLLMLPAERRMRAAGGAGHGIVALELAGSHARAREILAAWGAEGRQAARQSLWLDFGYAASYAALGVAVVEWVQRRTGRGPGAVVALPVVAAGADVVEGVALLGLLRAGGGEGRARLARTAALAKFGLLAASGVWAVGALVTARRA